MFAWADSKIVSGRSVDVQLGWNAGAPQCKVHQDAVFRRTDDVRAAMRKEDRGSSRRDVQSRRQFILFFRLQIARIDRDGKVGPATDVIYIVAGFVGSFLKAGSGRDGQVATSRETHDADLLRMELPLAGFAAHQADGPLGILERAASRLA